VNAPTFAGFISTGWLPKGWLFAHSQRSRTKQKVYDGAQRLARDVDAPSIAPQVIVVEDC